MDRKMIDIAEGYGILFANVRAGPAVEMPLRKALYRTLAVPVCCDVDSPPFDRSAMDGYAVRASDVAGAPVTLRVVGQVAAGSMSEGVLSTGEAIQINTGAPLPPGADAVVRVENTEQGGSDDDKVVILEAVEPGHFVAPRGTYASAGQTVLQAGTRLTPLEIGVAATAGCGTVRAYRQPTVAVLATGDELIDIDRRPTGAQIRDSNRHLLEALIAAAHARPVILGVGRDEREALRRKIEEGLRCDILCITGGVSMGTLDLVPEVLEDCGAHFHVRKLAIKPGRPVIFATTPDGTLIFALPGNPISTFVCFELLVRPAISALEGRPDSVSPPVRATLRSPLEPTRDRRTYIPARGRVNERGEREVETLSWQGSGDSLGVAGANVLIVRPPHAGEAKPGDAVSVILLDRA